MSSIALPTKPHYPILDGLRGVAAIAVVIFHIFEAHAPNRFEQIVNHGYLAVDFFFLLSGFVIGYAYDDRWKELSTGNFFKRRLIRLQPMVIMGMITGAAFFYFQDSAMFPNIHTVSVWKMLLVMIIGCTLLPVPVSMDLRGWGEMHPLDGPAWSLFFEYIGNILYAVLVRRFSKLALWILVILAGIGLIHYTVTGQGDVIGGWSLDPTQLRIGFTRLLFPFFAGLLLYRMAKLTTVKNAFFWCSLLLLLVLSVPRIGGKEHLWMNGLYESMIIILIFPLIVYMGASSQLTSSFSTRICKFLGDISYPLYITHYPLIYTYTGWASNHRGATATTALPYAALTFSGSIILAWAFLKWYDEPVRKWLQKKLMITPQKQ